MHRGVARCRAEECGALVRGQGARCRAGTQSILCAHAHLLGPHVHRVCVHARAQIWGELELLNQPLLRRTERKLEQLVADIDAADGDDGEGDASSGGSDEQGDQAGASEDGSDDDDDDGGDAGGADAADDSEDAEEEGEDAAPDADEAGDHEENDEEPDAEAMPSHGLDDGFFSLAEMNKLSDEPIAGDDDDEELQALYHATVRAPTAPPCAPSGGLGCGCLCWKTPRAVLALCDAAGPYTHA
jgi:hypothetical protein